MQKNARLTRAARHDLIARLQRFAAVDRRNAEHFPEGPVRTGMSARAQVMEDALAALGHSVAPPAPGAGLASGDDEVQGAAEEAAARAAPTRA